MHFKIPQLAVVATALAALSGPSMAFWRLPCRGVLTVARLDPIVEPGVLSMHAHSIHGGGRFSMNVTNEELLASDCTSCEVKQDKSAYWTPSLYFVHPSGEAEIVKQVGGMLVYYLPRGDNVKAFPKDFRMLTGDTFQRNFSLPTPDPPKSLWTAKDKTQFALTRKAIGFNCLNYDTAPEPSLFRHDFPNKEFLDSKCKDGIRMELVFPSCWNGKDLDSPDHQSHIAYPDLVDVGTCPEGFGTRLVTLMFETIWDTNAFKGQQGRFVIANGDPTGFGYHGDFMNAWEDNVLQQAIDQCTNLSGRVQDCPLFQLQSEDEQRKCKMPHSSSMGDERYDRNPEGLPGNVPILAGPAYAKTPFYPPPPAAPAAPKNTPALELPIPKLKVPSHDQPTSTQSKTAPVPQASVTKAPEMNVNVENNDQEQPYSTSYSTKGNTVYEIVFVQRKTTHTVSVPAATSQANPQNKKREFRGRFHRHHHAFGH